MQPYRINCWRPDDEADQNDSVLYSFVRAASVWIVIVLVVIIAVPIRIMIGEPPFDF